METQAALEELLLPWRGRLFAVAYRELPGRYDDAQDAVAAAFVRIVRHSDQLRDLESFGAWACQITRREARRIAARPPFETLPESLAEPLSDSALRLDIESALRRLPAELAQTLALYYQQGLSVAELAHRLETPEGTIKWRLLRGRERLRDALEGYKPMEKRTCALVALGLEPSLRTSLNEVLHATGWTEVLPIATFDEAAQLTTESIILEETIGTHSAFELVPLLRQRPNCRIWLLLNPGRSENEKQLAATAAYIARVDFLLNKPFTQEDFQHFARRLFATST